MTKPPYLLQQLRKACEWLVHEGTLDYRLRKAATPLAQLIGNDTFAEHSEALHAIIDTFSNIDALSDDEAKALSQSILSLFESVASST